MSGADSVPPPEGDMNNNDDKMDTTDAPVVADGSASINASVDDGREVDNVTLAIGGVHVAQEAAASTNAPVAVDVLIPAIESSEAERRRAEFANDEDLLGNVTLDDDDRMEEDVTEEQ